MSTSATMVETTMKQVEDVENRVLRTSKQSLKARIIGKSQPPTQEASRGQSARKCDHSLARLTTGLVSGSPLSPTETKRARKHAKPKERREKQERQITQQPTTAAPG